MLPSSGEQWEKRMIGAVLKPDAETRQGFQHGECAGRMVNREFQLGFDQEGLELKDRDKSWEQR